MKKNYITALMALIEQGSTVDVVLSNFKAVARKKGHESLIGGVLVGLERALIKKQKDNAAILTLAQEGDETKYAQAIAAAQEHLKLDEAPSISIDTNLIGGFTLRYKGVHIDHSYKNTLLNLYKSITK
jgi:F0F1-type ATP synthase delta subunit